MLQAKVVSLVERCFGCYGQGGDGRRERESWRDFAVERDSSAAIGEPGHGNHVQNLKGDNQNRAKLLEMQQHALLALVSLQLLCGRADSLSSLSSRAPVQLLLAFVPLTSSIPATPKHGTSNRQTQTIAPNQTHKLSHPVHRSPPRQESSPHPFHHAT